MRQGDNRGAQFRGVSMRPDRSVCGQVNAKNSYGAMAGFQFFYTGPGGYGAVLEPSDAAEIEQFHKRYSCTCYDKSVRDETAKITKMQDICPGE